MANIPKVKMGDSKMAFIWSRIKYEFWICPKALQFFTTVSLILFLTNTKKCTRMKQSKGEIKKAVVGNYTGNIFFPSNYTNYLSFGIHFFKCYLIKINEKHSS